MTTAFYSNASEVKFINKLRESIELCSAFRFSVSFIKKPGLKLIAPSIKAALERGACGQLITSTYQNFTDIESLQFFNELQIKYPRQFSCHLDKDCFFDCDGNAVGFHSKGYLFEFVDHNEILVGSSNITVFALLKNVEWNVSVIEDGDDGTYAAARREFDALWERTIPLTGELIDEYKTRLYYAIERWDMDYQVANSAVKPNYMQRRALKELNRYRVTGSTKALVVASAGSGKTYLAAFDALNFNPRKLLYIAHEGSILMKAYESFQRVFGSDRSFGVYNGEFKETDADFLFSTNVTMANSLELFDSHEWDYIIVDECHHATAGTYRKILNYFEPQFLLGITATPERMDGCDVFSLFDKNVPYELRLRDAIINDIVVPFKYYGIKDDFVEYDTKSASGHRFVEQFSDEKHCDFIHRNIEKYRIPGQKLKALAFCRDRSHAIRMAQAMEDYYHTQYLTGKNSTGERIRAYKDLQDDAAELEILFTVDILNEGVDIPGVNMVLFLRPTDSQTVFIQQLGRGLRKCEGKEFVTVLDFIGNDYKRSVQIAFALGSLSEKFVLEKRLVAALVKDDFESIGLGEYGVEICFDDLSKKEILSHIDGMNFYTKTFLKQDYFNFKKYLGTQCPPSHVDYLNNDFAPDLIRFMQSKSEGKNGSYYGFLRAIGEGDLPLFDERQEAFVRYVSEMLPVVRPHEYLIARALLDGVGSMPLADIVRNMQVYSGVYTPESFEHAVRYMKRSGFVREDGGVLALADIRVSVELDEYLRDLISYGLGRFDIEYAELDPTCPFRLWSHYRKDQVQQLLLKNPGDIMKGTKNYGGIVYSFVTIVKDSDTKDDLKYADGYIDASTFQWETVANVGSKELSDLKSSKAVHLFVRKASSEGGITLPFTYIGKGKLEHIDGSRKANGAHLFRIPMENTAPEDIYFDFKLP